MHIDFKNDGYKSMLDRGIALPCPYQMYRIFNLNWYQNNRLGVNSYWFSLDAGLALPSNVLHSHTQSNHYPLITPMASSIARCLLSGTGLVYHYFSLHPLYISLRASLSY